MTLVVLQMGPRDREDSFGIFLVVFRDEASDKRLVDPLDKRLGGIVSNWREANCMETLITVVHRLFEL
jgi:hypothetical protein